MSNLQQYPYKNIHEQISNALDKENIPHLDLLGEFEDKDPIRMQAAPGIDPHPNEIAHRIIAKALFHYLLDNSFIDESFRPKNYNMLNRDSFKRKLIKAHQPLFINTHPE